MFVGGLCFSFVFCCLFVPVVVVVVLLLLLFVVPLKYSLHSLPLKFRSDFSANIGVRDLPANLFEGCPNIATL